MSFLFAACPFSRMHSAACIQPHDAPRFRLVPDWARDISGWPATYRERLCRVGYLNSE